APGPPPGPQLGKADGRTDGPADRCTDKRPAEVAAPVGCEGVGGQGEEQQHPDEQRSLRLGGHVRTPSRSIRSTSSSYVRQWSATPALRAGGIRSVPWRVMKL